MAESISGSPVFANRYRFEPVDDDWDTGRTGFTHPAFDIVEDRKVVIKRADVTSPQSRQHEQSLKNEEKALKELKGLGVPELYDIGIAWYGNQEFTFLVLEYIDAIRVEKEVASLSPIDRARILYELFRLLAKSHHRGVGNGDIDLKHLFWSPEEKQLHVIDWGNSSSNTSSQRNHTFSFDMARSAEIIYALVVQNGAVPVTGSLALPEDDKLVAGLLPLPEEFYTLCNWAPRNPSEDMRLPFKALDLFSAIQKWISSIDPLDQYSDVELDELIRSQNQTTHSNWLKYLIGAAIFITAVAALSFWQPLSSNRQAITQTIIAAEVIQHTLQPPTKATTQPSSVITNATVTPTDTELPLHTLTSTAAPLPRKYIEIFAVDKTLSETLICWTADENFGDLDKRYDGNWEFQSNKSNASTDLAKANFEKCFDVGQVSAIGLNFWMQRINPNSQFGIYIEDKAGYRRDYIIRTELTDSTLHLMVNDNENKPIDYIQLIIKPDLEGTALSPFYQYSVKLFLDLNNQGQDTIYFSPGSGLHPLPGTELSINIDQMKKVDTRLSLDNIQSVGLIGFGPDIQAVIWPMVFYEAVSQ